MCHHTVSKWRRHGVESYMIIMDMTQKSSSHIDSISETSGTFHIT